MHTDKGSKPQEKLDIKKERANPALIYAKILIDSELDSEELKAKIIDPTILNEHELKLVNAMQNNDPGKFFRLMAHPKSKAFSRSDVRILIGEAKEKWGSHWMIGYLRGPVIESKVPFIPKDQVLILEKEIAKTGCNVIAKGQYEGNIVIVKTRRPFTGLPMKANPATALLNEARLLLKAASNHVIHCHGMILSEEVSKPSLVLEYASGGSLYSALKKSPFPPIKQLKLAKEISEGVSYIHSLGIIHRDLKSLNIVIVEDGSLRLIDFGSSTDSTEDTKVQNLRPGTEGWLAPEKIITQASDVYSLGVIIFEIVTREFKVPTSLGLRPISFARLLGEPITFPQGVPFLFSYLISLCTHLNPDKRPPAYWVRNQFDLASRAAYILPPELGTPKLQPLDIKTDTTTELSPIPSREELSKITKASLEQQTKLKPVKRWKYEIMLLSCFRAMTFTDFMKVVCSDNSKILFWFCFYTDKEALQEYIAQALSEKNGSPKVISSIQGLVKKYGLNPHSLYAKVKPETPQQLQLTSRLGTP